MQQGLKDSDSLPSKCAYVNYLYFLQKGVPYPEWRHITFFLNYLLDLNVNTWLHCVCKCTHEILHLPSLHWIALCHHNMWFLPLRAAIKRLYHYLNDKTRTLGMIICSSARCYQYETHPLLVTADGWSVSEVIYPLTSSVSGADG